MGESGQWCDGVSASPGGVDQDEDLMPAGAAALLQREERTLRSLRGAVRRAALQLRDLKRSEKVDADERRRQRLESMPGPLTRETRLRRSYARREEELWRRLRAVSDARRVHQGLAHLQALTRERLRRWECSRQSRARRELVRLGVTARRLQLDVVALPAAALPRLRQHLHTLKTLRHAQLQRRVLVLQQLLSEELYRKRQRRPPPLWKPKPRPKKPADEVPVEPEKIEILPTIEEEVKEEVPEVEEEIPQIEEEPEPVQKKGKKEKKEKKEKEPKGKKKKAEPPPPPLPPVFRRRVEAGEEWASALAGPLGWLPPLGDDEAAIRRPPTQLAPADEFFHWRPDAVVFEEFGPGERHVRRCSLHNSSYLPARVVLLEPELDDDLWLRRLDIRPRPSPTHQLLVLPGQAIHITVTLNAPGLEEWPAGALPSVCGSMRALVACRAWAGCAPECRRGLPRLLELPFRCVPVLPPPPPPAPPEPSTDFTVIDFGAVPGWTETGRIPCYTRHLTLRNTGGRPCIASIHPLKDEPTPVESPEEASEEEVEEEEVIVKPQKSGKKQKKSPRAKPQPKVVESVEPPKSEAELLREEAEAVIAWLLGEAAAEAVHEFQWRADCRWTCLPPGALLRLPITFRPPEAGRYRRRYSVCFYSIPEEEEKEEEEEGKKMEEGEEEEEKKDKEELLLQVELEALGESVLLPVWVEPAGGVQLGAGWCAPVRCAGPLQQLLRVRAPPSLGPLSLRLSPGPPALQRRELLQLLPRHDAVLRPEEGMAEFLLRLWPRPCLVEEAWRCGLWEDGALSGLQVEARVLTRLPGDPPPPLAPPLLLPVLPIAVIWPRGRLQLRLDSKPPPLPEAASTLETLQLQLLLVNTSDAIPLRFAVLGAPPGALVFPSRGWVLRGERLPLQLLLSPRAGHHVPLGRTSTWQLRLRAVCVEQLADELDLRLQQSNREVPKPRTKRRWIPGPCKERLHKPGSWKDKLEEQPSAEQLNESQSSKDSLDDQPIAEHLDTSGGWKENLEDQPTEENLDKSGSWKEKPEEPPTAEQLGLLDEGGADGDGSWLCVEVPVVDPRCELSACRLLLPAVVLGGIALVRVSLRGGNAASRSTAIVHCLPPKAAAAAATAWRSATFTAHCDHADVTVSPTRGALLPGQEVVLYVAFRPRLRRRDVEREKAAIQDRRLQAMLEQQQREKAEKGKKKGGAKKGGSEKGGSQKSDGAQTPKSSRRNQAAEVPAVTSAEDLLEAEATLLRAFQPRKLRRLLTCHVSTVDARTKQTRVERLRLELWCPVSRPAFQLLGPPVLDFGPTAAGTCRRMPLRLRSLDAAEVDTGGGGGGEVDAAGGGGDAGVGGVVEGGGGGDAVGGRVDAGGGVGGATVGRGATGGSGVEAGGGEGDAGGGMVDTGGGEGGAAGGGAAVAGGGDAEGGTGGIGLYFSPPSPDSPFWLPHCILKQAELPAGREVSVPVCYRPAPDAGDEAQAEPEEECDCVSVREVGGDTALRVQLRGRRVAPRLTLTPKGVTVWRSEAAAGATVDCAKIDVRNDCEAELRLGVVVEAVLAAPDVPPPEPSEAVAPPSPSTKGSKKSKGKPQAKKVQKQSAELQEEERAELESTYQPVPEDQRQMLFSTMPLPAEFELKPGGKASLKVQFTAPAPPEAPQMEEPVKKDKEKGKEKGKDKEKGKEKGKGKQRDKSAEGTVTTQDTQPTNVTVEQPAEPRMKYAARMAVMVGGVVRMQELWFLCTTKEASAKDKKKKKKK